MTLQELILRYEFETIVPDLITIDPDKIPSNLYAFKEAFDNLRRMPPGDPGGEQIVVDLFIDTDDDGVELDRYIYADNCEGDAWDSCLAKEVVFGENIGEAAGLARILWHLTFWDFTPTHEGFPDWIPRNKYEVQAEALERKQFLNYAKGIANSLEIENICLSMEGWEEYDRRKAHRNRPKRMRDARQDRSIARLKRKGKVQNIISRILAANPAYALCPENRDDILLLQDLRATPVTADSFRYLFDTKVICELDFYSRTPDSAGRANYISQNIFKYFKDDTSTYTKAVLLIESSSDYPLKISEYEPLDAAISHITSGCGHAVRLFGTNSTLGHDIHILLALSR